MKVKVTDFEIVFYVVVELSRSRPALDWLRPVVCQVTDMLTLMPWNF